MAAQTGQAKAGGAPGIENENFLVLCHSDKHEGRRGSGSGPLEPILQFLLRRRARHVFVIEQSHPHPHLPAECEMEVYRDGEKIDAHVCEKWRALYYIPPERRRGGTPLRYKLRDVIADEYFFRLIRRRYLPGGPIRYAIGVESLNALCAAAWHRRLGIRSVVYYTFDWTPRRYANPLMSRAFLWLDRQACYRSDFLWNVSDAIAETRLGLLRYDARRMGLQLTVPYGLEFQARHVGPAEQADAHRVIFTGGLYEDNGVLLLPDIARELARLNPRIRLVVAGDGPLDGQIRERLRAEKLTNVELTGHIQDLEQLHALMGSCGIGLAPYPDTELSTKKYGDVIKIRSYFACGLVVVTTRIPPSAREVERENLGVVTPIEPAAMAAAIAGLCADRKRFLACHENVIRKAQAHGWDDILDRTFLRMSRPV